MVGKLEIFWRKEMVRVVSLKHLAIRESLAKRRSVELIEEAGESFEKVDLAPNEEGISIEELTSLLKQGIKCFVLYPSPEVILEEHLDRELELEKAVHLTASYSEDLVSVYKNYRKQLKLLNECHVGYATTQGIESIHQLGLRVTNLRPIRSATTATTLALHIIKSHNELSRAVNTLDGCSVVINNSWKESVVEQSVANLKELRKSQINKDSIISKLEKMNKKAEAEKADLMSQLDEKSQEAKLHLTQLVEIQEQLERQAQSHKADKRELQNQIDELLEKSVDEKLELAIENKLLLNQIFNLQAELEAYFTTLKQSEAKNTKEHENVLVKNELITKLKLAERQLKIADKQVKELSKSERLLSVELRHVKSELASIRSSVAWKASKPVRVLTSVVSKTKTKNRKIQADLDIINSSDLFDAEWYVKTYPDVKKSGIDPAEHYLNFGWLEGRYPSQYFDGTWYLNRYPDVSQSDTNPLLHYLKFGKDEGRLQSPKLLEHNKKKSTR